MADKLTGALQLLFVCIKIQICRRQATVVLSGRSNKDDQESNKLGQEGDKES